MSKAKRKTSYDSQSGNVLFYILIAVAMLAALSFAVSQGNRGGTQGLNEDRAKLYAGEIIEYANTVANAVAQIKLRGYSDTEISFENSIVSGYGNPNCTDDVCKIFHPSGGGLSYLKPAPEWLDNSFSANNYYNQWLISGTNWVTGIGISALGGASNCIDGSGNCRELLIVLPYIKEQLCKEINKMTHHGKADGTAFVDAGNSAGRTIDVKFIGTYATSGANMGEASPASDNYTNLNSGCIEGDASPPSGAFTFYKVLIVR